MSSSRLRLRAVARAELPSGATVVVISKGDDELLDLGVREAWHFPQDDQGAYAGHHPADSAAAIGALEALRKKGAQFLVVPAGTRSGLTFRARWTRER